MGEAPTRVTTVPCPRCGEPMEFHQVEVMNQWIPRKPGACDSCIGRSREEEDARREEASAETRDGKRAGRVQQVRELLENAGASPWEHGSASFETFDSTECGPDPLEAAREFTHQVVSADRYDPIPGLYLSGPTGSGKTHLATAVARQLLLEPSIEPGSIVFDPADVLISRIRSLYGGKGDVDAFLRKRETARVWILDDLGREPPHPDVVGHLTMLIAQRALRGVVITGNLHPSEYETRHADLGRIGSRLGPAYFRTVRVEGRDRRFDGARV